MALFPCRAILASVNDPMALDELDPDALPVFAFYVSFLLSSHAWHELAF